MSLTFKTGINQTMKKYLYILLALALLMLASAEKSFACSCPVPIEPLKKQVQSAFSSADTVFSGEVIEIKESPTDKYSLLVKFKVAKSWKGESKNEITITTAKENAMCGYSFETGKTYLVYANGQNEDLFTTNCSRTATFSKRGDVKYLDKLKRKKTNSN
jgi:hypothetical protein